ncbi:MAG: ABC transporter permease [Bryobacteraceae bacterium]|nr:ABC transporter permease [Bryobacteraceae bacterium]MDW8380402.1 FtsX-like permease family protein [Bryobacterales bacterium]
MINKLVIENLKHRWVRTVLSATAVGVQVTMILTLVGVSYGTLDDLSRRSRGAGADILIRPPGSSIISLSTAPMPEKILDFVRSMPHVAVATGTIVQPIGGTNSVTGIDLESFEKMSGGFRFLSGGPFRNPEDVIIDEYWARQFRLSVGSPMHFMDRTWRVSGIVEPGKLARIFLPLKLVQELSANTGKLTMVYVKLDDPRHLADAMAALKNQLPTYQIYSIEEFVSQISVNNLPQLKTFIYVVIGVAVVVGFLVVFLSMYTAVLERTREIGILKSLGATPALILGILIRETIVLSLIGSVFGILFTYGTRWAIMRFVPGSLNQIIVPEWWPVASLVALVGSLLGALYPGWIAAKQDPIEALSYE